MVLWYVWYSRNCFSSVVLLVMKFECMFGMFECFDRFDSIMSCLKLWLRWCVVLRLLSGGVVLLK